MLQNNFRQKSSYVKFTPKNSKNPCFQPFLVEQARSRALNLAVPLTYPPLERLGQL